MGSAASSDGELLSFRIEPAVAVCGARPAEVPFPHHTAVVLIVRSRHLIPARGDSVLEAGHHEYVFLRPP